MASPDIDFGEDIVEDKERTGGSGGSSGPRIPDLDENAVDFILDALEQKGKFELPALNKDASELSEAVIDHYGFDDGTLNSVQDIFGLDWDDVDFVGTEPLAKNPNHPGVDETDVTQEDLELLSEDERTTQSGDPKKYVLDPEYATQFRDANVDDSTLSALSRGINAHRNDEIVERFGSDSRVKVSIGKKRNHEGDAAEQRRYVHFSTSDSDTAAEKREEWAAELEDGDEDE
jgi:hypothetical protein